MASGQWWVIAYTQETGTTYAYFQGSRAQAEAQANLAVKTAETSNLTGPYATKADAEAAVKAKKVNTGAQPNLGQAVSGLENEASSILGLPQLSNLRNLVIRSAKVIVGMLLIAVGAVKLLHVEQAVKDVAPIAAKAAVL